MNNLILGGAGFIGQYLSHGLLKTRQERVTIIDNLKTSSINLEDFAHYKNLFEFINADLTSIDDEEFMKIGRKNHRIFHLAASVGVKNVIQNPKDTLFNNMQMSCKLIPLFEKLNRPVLYTSTSEVYGEGPFNEDSDCKIGTSKNLRWSYASSKLTTEFMMNSCNFPSTIVRLFNVVGKGQSSQIGMVLPNFIESAKRNEDIIVHGDGKQVRSFCHVKDAVNAMIKLISFNGETFNIGNDSPITMEDLAYKVKELLNSNSNIVYKPLEKVYEKNFGDISKRIPNLDKIRKTINYKPSYDLDEIIKEMI
jgi:UDP-glucose 4-epimerase